MRAMRLLFVTLAAVFLSTTAQAQKFPELTGRVVDNAKLLSPDQVAQITQMSATTEEATGRQLVVATIPDLQGYPIEEFGYRLGRHWKIGQKDANNGVILLVAPNERKVRIEVGYGLEPIVTDAVSGIIIRDTIIPAFKAGDMGGGVVAGATEIDEQLKLPLEAAEERAKALIDAKKKNGDGDDWGLAIFWIFILIFFVLPIIFGAASGKSHRRGRAPVVIWGPGWGGGSGGGGSSWGGGGGSWGGGGGGFGGGGGGFGGGGASGGW